MAEHSTSTPRLLPVLFTLLAAHRPAVRQDRPFQRLCALSLGYLLCFGRHTLSQLLVALGLGDIDWSSFYRILNRARVNYELLCGCLCQEIIPATPPNAPLVVAIDGVHLSRHSQRMPGTSWHRHPQTPPFFLGIQRAQRFVNLAVLLPVSADGYSRAVPLRWVPAFPEKAVRPAGIAPTTEWEAAVAELHWLREQLDATGRHEQPVLSVADGHYSNQFVWSGLPERTTLLARVAKNRNLYALPTPHAGPGRPRRYGPKAPKPAAWLTERRGWQRTTLTVRGRTIHPRYRVEGPYVVKGAPQCPLYLLVVRGVDRRRGTRIRRDPAFWLVNANQDAAGTWVLPLAAEQLLAWAWQRWEIEVTHRELKSGFGLGEQQQWSATGAILAPQWTVWTYSVLVLTGYRAWGLGPSPQPPPVAGGQAGGAGHSTASGKRSAVSSGRSANFARFGRRPRTTGGKWPTGWLRATMPPSALTVAEAVFVSLGPIIAWTQPWLKGQSPGRPFRAEISRVLNRGLAFRFFHWRSRGHGAHLSAPGIVRPRRAAECGHLPSTRHRPPSRRMALLRKSADRCRILSWAILLRPDRLRPQDGFHNQGHTGATSTRAPGER